MVKEIEKDRERQHCRAVNRGNHRNEDILHELIRRELLAPRGMLVHQPLDGVLWSVLRPGRPLFGHGGVSCFQDRSHKLGSFASQPCQLLDLRSDVFRESVEPGVIPQADRHLSFEDGGYVLQGDSLPFVAT